MSGNPRVMPHDADIETRILGAVLKRPGLFDDLSAAVCSEAFYVGKHVVVWEAFGAVRKAGFEIGLVTVMDQLTRDGKLDLAGGPAGLAGLMVFESGQVEAMVDTLLEDFSKRRVLALAMQIQESAYNRGTKLVDVLPEPLKEMADAVTGRSRTEAQDPAKFIQEWLDRLDRLERATGSVLKTPFYGLNSLSSGFFPGEVIVVAARPGAGKTAFALNLVEYGVKKKKKIGVFSLEMSKFSLLDRLAASGRLLGSGRGMDAQRFRDGKFEDADWNHLYEFAGAVQEGSWRIWDRSSARPSEIRAQANAWKREMGGLDLLVIDYLQLTAPDSRGSSREREVGEVSRAMKTMALELDVPVLLLSQLSRDAERSKKPLLSHLRESGSIEQDADIVIFLSPQRTEETEEGYEVEVDVAKGRGNRTGSFRLMYRKRFLQFANLEQEVGGYAGTPKH